MRRPKQNPKFWSSDLSKWNFGDALSVLVFDELLVDFFPYRTRPWTIGSVLMEGAPSILQDRDNEWLPSFLEGANCQAVFWGCGLRGPETVSAEFLAHSAVLAVRGPLSASELRSGYDTPLGDPGLFLPALYEPAPIAVLAGKTVCVPHYQDARSDAEVISATGCDLVLRTSIEPSLAAVQRFIDGICSADFVLCGAMHAAIVAMAYGKPFGYWESGSVDVPFKWADLSSLVGIPCEFQKNIKAARRHYDQVTSKQISLPSLWPLICSAPAFVRPSGLLKVLRHEIRHREEDPRALLDSFILEMERRSEVFDRLVDLSRETADSLIPGLAEAAKAHERVAAELRMQLGALSLERRETEARLVEKTISLEAMRAEATLASQKFLVERAALEARLTSIADEISAAQAEIAANSQLFAAERVAYEIRLAQEADKLQTAQSEAAEAAQQFDSAKAAFDARLAEKARVLESALDDAALAAQRFDAAYAAFESRLDEKEDKLEAARADAALVAQRFDAAQAIYEVRLAEARADSQRCAAERTALKASLDRESGELGIARAEQVALARRLDVTVQQASQVVRETRALATKLPSFRKRNQELSWQIEKISEFLSRFSDAQLGMSSEGREDRILAYLLTLTSRIPDFPLLDRDLYLSMHPDVAASGLDPFIHYLDYGASEGRSPHPLLDLTFYTRTFPEVGRLPHSALEHYVRFGAAKGYNPCELFNTSYYLTSHADVKQSSCNPLIHYLRYPGCRPHRHFDSYGYMVGNTDVVRTGMNPLAHYLLWGRAEGRSPGLPETERLPIPETAAAVQPVPSVEVIRSTENQLPAEAAKARPIALMLDAFYPQPDKDSGSLDQVNFARIFTALGYEVAFASMMDFSPEDHLMQPMAALGVRCVTGRDHLNVEEFVFLNAERIAVFFLSRFNFGGAWIEKARVFCPQAQVIFNTVDLHHVREERHARLLGSQDALLHAEHTRQQELSCIAVSDVTIVVSEVERTLLEALAPSADVRVIPLIREVRQRSWPQFEERSGIVFVGGFQHQPNVDAVQYFLAEIWPKVLAVDPCMTFRVIGSHMPESLSGRTDPNVEWVGYVPELEPWLDKAHASVAPLRYGAGAKGKVVSSLLNGVPCVASPVAAEGMGLTGGAGILVAENPDEFAKELLAITRSPDRWRETSRLGFNAVARAYSLDRGIELMQQIIPRAIGN